jgi:predicted nucleic acid-binding Zn ribbon protein
MMFSFALTDKARPQCGMAFAASQPNAAFCSPECKNRFNVGKNRDKKKNGGSE